MVKWMSQNICAGLIEYEQTQFWSKNVKIYKNENDFNIFVGVCHRQSFWKIIMEKFFVELSEYVLVNSYCSFCQIQNILNI